MIRTVTKLGLCLLLTVPCLASAVPARLSFAARIADSGQPLTGNHDLAFAIYDSASGGTPLWAEAHPGAPVADGVAAVLLGEKTAIPSGLFNGADTWLEVTLDGQAMSPRLAIQSVPYAVRAGTAENALEAVHAASADTAASATSAVNATNAIHATQADTASSAATASAVPWGGIAGVPFAPPGGDAGSADTIARADHKHDAAYYTKANLQTSGQAQVNWTNLSSVPFTSPGGDSGSAASIARGDHVHDARYYTKAQLANSGGGGQVHWNNVTAKITPAVSGGFNNSPMTYYTTGWGCTSLAGFAVGLHAPAAGKILVTGQVSIWVNHTLGASNPDWATVGTSRTDCAAATNGVSEVNVPSSVPTFSGALYTLPLHRLVTVSGAGEYAFYVNGAGYSTDAMTDPALFLLFIPD